MWVGACGAWRRQQRGVDVLWCLWEVMSVVEGVDEGIELEEKRRRRRSKQGRHGGGRQR